MKKARFTNVDCNDSVFRTFLFRNLSFCESCHFCFKILHIFKTIINRTSFSFLLINPATFFNKTWISMTYFAEPKCDGGRGFVRGKKME